MAALPDGLTLVRSTDVRRVTSFEGVLGDCSSCATVATWAAASPATVEHVRAASTEGAPGRALSWTVLRRLFWRDGRRDERESERGEGLVEAWWC